MVHNKRYLKKKFENPLPPLPADERIYFNTTWETRDFAKVTNCGFDNEKKLWFTGVLNSNIESLIIMYGINQATSEKALKLLEEKRNNK